jgi:uncharacterized membrane protein (UPF0127 family)
MKHPLRIITFGSLGLLFLLLASLVSIATPQKKPKVTIGRVEFRVEIADEPSEWRRGLSDYETLKSGEGMLFIFPAPTPRTFWMKNMRFPIDIIWINRGVVVGYLEKLQPDSGEVFYPSPGSVDQVLEIGAGEREHLGIDIGAPVMVE